MMIVTECELYCDQEDCSAQRADSYNVDMAAWRVELIEEGWTFLDEGTSFCPHHNPVDLTEKVHAIIESMDDFDEILEKSREEKSAALAAAETLIRANTQLTSTVNLTPKIIDILSDARDAVREYTQAHIAYENCLNSVIDAKSRSLLTDYRGSDIIKLCEDVKEKLRSHVYQIEGEYWRVFQPEAKHAIENIKQSRVDLREFARLILDMC